MAITNEQDQHCTNHLSPVITSKTESNKVLSLFNSESRYKLIELCNLTEIGRGVDVRFIMELFSIKQESRYDNYYVIPGPELLNTYYQAVELIGDDFFPEYYSAFADTKKYLLGLIDKTFIVDEANLHDNL